MTREDDLYLRRMESIRSLGFVLWRLGCMGPNLPAWSLPAWSLRSALCTRNFDVVIQVG